MTVTRIAVSPQSMLADLRNLRRLHEQLLKSSVEASLAAETARTRAAQESLEAAAVAASAAAKTVKAAILAIEDRAGRVFFTPPPKCDGAPALSIVR